MTPPTDRALMRGIKKKDERACAELVMRHRGKMLAVAARLLGSRLEAEDAVQRAFLQCLTAASSYRPEWAVSTWLYRILTNICLDEIRRRGVRHRADLHPGPARNDTDQRAGVRLDVRRALGKVPNEARVLLVLRYIDGLSYGELARVRGISVNTVKSQLARGKAILKTNLTEGRQ